MRKLQLRVDDLVVESFETPSARNASGTVFGKETDLGMYEEEGSRVQTCQQWDTCQGEKTCNFGGACYTWEGGWTCAQLLGECTPPTDIASCTCPEEN
ncbi:MAG TPA: hypothetical protein VFQ76_04915 [Longimicrobiaceae bacterium]|nr:hypothetical protein [Longimicrobiaceae bacterium]